MQHVQLQEKKKIKAGMAISMIHAQNLTRSSTGVSVQTPDVCGQSWRQRYSGLSPKNSPLTGNQKWMKE